MSNQRKVHTEVFKYVIQVRLEKRSHRSRWWWVYEQLSRGRRLYEYTQRDAPFGLTGGALSYCQHPTGMATIVTKVTFFCLGGWSRNHFGGELVVCVNFKKLREIPHLVIEKLGKKRHFKGNTSYILS